MTQELAGYLPRKFETVRGRARHEIWGMTIEEWIAHTKKYGSSSNIESPMAKYLCHRSGAKARGIEWKFDFKGWWAVWEKSGKWKKRGRSGYVMGRHNDGKTPYSTATVAIITARKNVQDGHFNSRESRRLKVKGGAGSGRGYSVAHSKSGITYVARFRDKFLGRFTTEDEAHTAYRSAYLAAAAAAKN